MKCQLKTNDGEATWLVMFWDPTDQIVRSEYWCRNCAMSEFFDEIISMTNLEFGEANKGLRE